MLDILRSTKETKDTKVIMMTALSQAEDKARAAKLGADHYLVKSQVTLEDVARVARDVLGGTDSTKSPGQSPPVASATSPAAPPPVATTAAPTAPATPDSSASSVSPAPTEPPVAQPVAPQPVAQAAPATQTIDVQVHSADDAPVTTPSEPTPAPVTTPSLNTAVASVNGGGAAQPATPPRPAVRKKIIVPINDLSKAESHLQNLLAQEQAKEAGTDDTPPPPNSPVTAPSNAAAPSVDPNSISL